MRWYGILFAVGLYCAGMYVWRRFQENNLPQKTFEQLFIFGFLGIFLGARLGHCLFYEFDYYASRPLEMIFPIAINGDGSWEIVSYQGLASHGACLCLILALTLLHFVKSIPILKIMDYVAIASPLACGFIRMGNLMNSEIAGNVTSVPWAFVFTAIDQSPRHPTQLYEALAYFLIFAICATLYAKGYKREKAGFYLGFSTLLIMSFRFCIEWIKMPQELFEEGMRLNMGQWLSIPYILFGLYLMFRPTKPVIDRKSVV